MARKCVKKYYLYYLFFIYLYVFFLGHVNHLNFFTFILFTNQILSRQHVAFLHQIPTLYVLVGGKFYVLDQ